MRNIMFFEEFILENEMQDDDLFEAKQKRDPKVVAQEQESKIKNAIERYSEMMKANPEKANLYKAQLELAMAKGAVLKARAKVDQLKAAGA